MLAVTLAALLPAAGSAGESCRPGGQWDPACLRQRADQPISHDYLFSTILGLLDLETTVRTAAYDLTAACRSPATEPIDARDADPPARIAPLASQAGSAASPVAWARR